MGGARQMIENWLDDQSINPFNRFDFLSSVALVARLIGGLDMHTHQIARC